jgi:cysteine desulfurase / selenocysteine lyase
VQFLSGFRVDLKALGELCASKNVLFSVDAIQSVGAIRHDLQETPVDFLSAGVQKWQMGCQGVAIIFVSEKTQELIRQSHLGWLSVKNAWNFFDYRLDLLDDARRYENATYNSMGLYAYNGALRFFKDIGFDAVETMVRANAEYAYKRAAELGFELLTPSDPAQRAGIVSFRHADSEGVCQALLSRKITISARAGHLRLSPHFYNTFEEIDETLDAIVALT